MEKPPTSEQMSTEDYISLAERLNESIESLPFPGLTPEAYLKLKAESEEFPEYMPPIDELIKAFEREGMKVVVIKKNAFVIPAGSSNLERDSIFPKLLNITDNMSGELRELILAQKK